MNEEQLIKEIENYINDETYNYAVLINGEWGCGKTFFVKNVLMDKLQKFSECQGNVFYWSLYGFRLIDDIKENVFLDLMGDFAEKKIKNRQKGNKDKFLENYEKSYGKKAFNNSINRNSLILKILHKVNINDFYELINPITFNDKVLIFDDLERCMCPINEVLGFINSLVEHENAKVIIIANENEIGGIDYEEPIELQYLVAGNNNITVQEDKSEYQRVRNDVNKKKDISIDELERRRNVIFKNKQKCEEYKRIREKLIGVTFNYEADFDIVIDKIINNSTKDIEVKGFLQNNKDKIISKFKTRHYHNLRAFQFFVSKFNHIFKQVRIVDIDEKYFNRIIEYLIEETLDASILFKAGNKESINHNDPLNILINGQNYSDLVSVKEYVETGKLDKEKLSKEIDYYLENKIKNVLDPSDPYCLLFNEYFLHTQVWVQKKIEEVIEKLKNDEYPVSAYSNIMILFVRLKDIGFSEDIIKEAKNFMVRNISNKKELRKIPLEYIFIENKDQEREVKELINKINVEILKVTKENERDAIVSFFEDRDWAIKLQKYLDSKNDLEVLDILPLLSKFDSNTWIKHLDELDSKNIISLRVCLGYLYSENRFDKRIYQDMGTLKDIIDNLKDKIDTETDLIRKDNLKWLFNQMEKIYQRHGVEWKDKYIEAEQFAGTSI